MAWFFSRAGNWRREEYQCDFCKEKKLHHIHARNCRYFPAEWDSNRRPCWAARIGDGRSMRVIPGTSINECPVSYITSESLNYLGLVRQAKIAKEFGGALFGPDSSLWPARYSDAIMVVSDCETEELMARPNVSHQ